MNNIINVHSEVEEGLFWSNIRKEGHSVLVYKQVIVSTLGLEFNTECQNSNHFNLIFNF